MGSNIFGVGQSALSAAQLGIATTGHNIANASTPGYNRQVILQAANEPQNLGGSFIGQGVSVTQIQRQYNSFLAGQVNSSQSAQNQAAIYNSQISQINNLVADPTAGVTPALQDFFKSFQNLAASPNGTAGAAARQAAVSSAQALAGRLNSLQTRLDQIREDVNGQIGTTVGAINSYATQLANLNDVIEKAQGTSTIGNAPNDLLDQRDQLVTELSKLTKVSVVPQGPKYNVFIGNGQPLVLGSNVNQLAVSQSLTDPSRTEVSYLANGASVLLPENSFAGGKLGGLLDFRASTLDVAQNSIGRIAIGVATQFNDQQKLGLDLNGQTGGSLFNIAGPVSTPSALNTSTAAINASITDTTALTTSDYRLQFIGGNYKITRLSDGATQSSATLPLKFDGINFQLAPPPAAAVPNAGDEFLIRPTAAGGSSISVAIQDPAKLAAAAPLTTAFPTTNTGSGKISVGVANSQVASGSNSATATIGAVATDDTYLGTTLAAPLTLTYSGGNITGFPAGATVSVKVGAVTTNYPPPATVPYTSGATISFSGVSFAISDGAAPAPVGPPANGDTFTLSAALPVAATKLTFNSAGNTLTGFPANANVTVTNGGTSTTYPAGSAIPYTSGSTISYNGISFSVSGNPANGDIFNVGPNTNGSGDNRNAVILSSLQTQNTVAGKTTTFQGGYAQFVSLVGNKAHEVEITTASETKLLAQNVAAQQSESGVNLDEEAANLLRYQQAYQAAGKLMQIASTLFDQLLSLGSR
ncbi:flagellar hook-associated protein FlgK [Undibacterium sp. TS12]|uniref:flagellar hook-associated protein FlgK n=1 Tax=Undibacterium sp. TS12 TaxID=2908202 RepID=UPI001F4C5FE7|nr:flagellar hook-associated protein FlgK [Undibacterium sp. TS12]MCH8619016.1 flagellar hook-associated protein FlgK [Undibacterium sp. TS12]